MATQRIITNTFANSGGKFVNFLLQLVIISYLVRTQGAEAYGVIVLALALAANIELFEAGFGLAAVKYIAEYRAKGDYEKILEVINTNFLVTTLLAAVFSGILLAVNELFLDRLFSIPPSMLAETQTLIRILTAACVIEFWAICIIRVGEGFQRYPLLRLIGIIKWVLRLLFIIASVEKGYGIISVGIAYLGTAVIHLFLLYQSVFVKDHKLRVDLFLVNKESFHLLFGFSIWVFLAKIFAFISYKIDVFLIGIFLLPINLTYYNIAFKIYEALMLGLLVIPSALMPVASELNTLADKEKLRLLFCKVTRYTTAFMWPLLVFCLFFSRKIINLWVGKEFGVSVFLTNMFLISLFFLALTSSGAELMVGLNRVKDLAFCNGIASTVNLLVSIILVKEIGVSGVVVGTLVGACIFSVSRLYFMLPTFDLSLKEFLSQVILKQGAGLILLGGVLLILPVNLFSGIIILLCYYIMTIVCIVDKDDRKKIKQALFPTGRKITR